jgi:hypothetical protein
MNIENLSSLLFLDVLVNKQLDGTLGHMVYNRGGHNMAPKRM